VKRSRQISSHHAVYLLPLGGTITVDFETFSRLLRGIVGSLVRHGFRRILLLNGHGGNIAALDLIVGELTREHAIPLASVNYWLVVPDVAEGLLERQTALHHACEGETSLMLAVAPELVDTDRLREAHGRQEGDPKMALGPGMGRWFSFAERTDSGVIGDAALATADKGRVLIAAIVERLAETLTQPDFWAGPERAGS
jgi:creatinine amidohydrolase